MSPPIAKLDPPSRHRPAVSSPLSSSPLRPPRSASPLSPRDQNALPGRQVRSSPIAAPKFQYACRNARPNPLRRSREKAQEGRRKLFLQNVRQRSDDKAWERRGGDQEVLKLEWTALDRLRREQKSTDIDGVVHEGDIDELSQLQGQAARAAQGPDEIMVDAMAQDEEAEVDAMLSMFEAHAPSPPPRRPDSPAFSDDEDYDRLFAGFLPRQEHGPEDLVLSGQMDLS